MYVGYWDTDNIHGMGIYIYESNNVNTGNKNQNGNNLSEKYAYIGEFSHGKFNGIGKLVLIKNDR